MIRAVWFSFVLLFSSCLAQNYSAIPKWADFGLYGGWGFKDLEFKLEFTMDNYEIFSIEKCTGNGNGFTVSLYHYNFKSIQKNQTITNSMMNINPIWDGVANIR